MRLLITTQKVDKNDAVLGFFHTWIEEFSKHAESVTVICLEKGEYDLPHNVRVFSLGKESGKSRIKYLLNFYRYIWRERKSYDKIFVHMNPEYVVLGGPLWKLLGKPVYLWYVHRQVNLKLKVALVFVKKVFTSSKESLRVATDKAVYMGHGIDTEKFRMPLPIFSTPLSILHLGRVTRIKHIETFVQAVRILNDEGIEARLVLAGDTVTLPDEEYKKELQKLIHNEGVEDRVKWAGSLEATDAFAQAGISVNGAPEGGMDKAVLESLAAGRPVFVANEAFKEVFGEYWDFFSYGLGDYEGLARKIRTFLALPDGQKEVLIRKLEEKVRVEYDVRTLIKEITTRING